MLGLLVLLTILSVFNTFANICDVSTSSEFITQIQNSSCDVVKLTNNISIYQNITVTNRTVLIDGQGYWLENLRIFFSNSTVSFIDTKIYYSVFIADHSRINFFNSSIYFILAITVSFNMDNNSCLLMNNTSVVLGSSNFSFKNSAFEITNSNLRGFRLTLYQNSSGKILNSTLNRTFFDIENASLLIFNNSQNFVDESNFNVVVKNNVFEEIYISSLSNNSYFRILGVDSFLLNLWINNKSRGEVLDSNIYRILVSQLDSQLLITNSSMVLGSINVKGNDSTLQTYDSNFTGLSIETDSKSKVKLVGNKNTFTIINLNNTTALIYNNPDNRTVVDESSFNVVIKNNLFNNLYMITLEGYLDILGSNFSLLTITSKNKTKGQIRDNLLNTIVFSTENMSVLIYDNPNNITNVNESSFDIVVKNNNISIMNLYGGLLSTNTFQEYFEVMTSELEYMYVYLNSESVAKINNSSVSTINMIVNNSTMLMSNTRIKDYGNMDIKNSYFEILRSNMSEAYLYMSIFDQSKGIISNNILDKTIIDIFNTSIIIYNNPDNVTITNESNHNVIIKNNVFKETSLYIDQRDYFEILGSKLANFSLYLFDRYFSVNPQLGGPTNKILNNEFELLSIEVWDQHNITIYNNPANTSTIDDINESNFNVIVKNNLFKYGLKLSMHNLESYFEITNSDIPGLWLEMPEGKGYIFNNNISNYLFLNTNGINVLLYNNITADEQDFNVIIKNNRFYNTSLYIFAFYSVLEILGTSFKGLEAYLEEGTNFRVMNSSFSSNITLSILNLNNVTFYNNKVTADALVIDMSEAYDKIIFHAYNNIFNVSNIFINTSDYSIILLNDSVKNQTSIIGRPYSGGNYWGKPDNTGYSDLCSEGEYEGICSEPFNISENITDHYPLTLRGSHLDTTLPDVNITNPGDRVTSSTVNVNVSFELWDDLRLSRYELYLNGSLRNNTSVVTNDTYNEVLTNLGPGVYNVRVVVYDTMNNSDEDNVTFIVYSVPGDGRGNTGSNGNSSYAVRGNFSSNTSNNNYTINLSVDNSVSWVVELIVDGQVVNNTSGSGPSNISLGYTFPQSGNYTYGFNVTYTVGNSSVTSYYGDYNAWIDLYEPNITVIWPEQDQSYTKGYRDLSFRVEDDFAQVLTCIYNISGTNYQNTVLVNNNGIYSESLLFDNVGIYVLEVTCSDGINTAQRIVNFRIRQSGSGEFESGNSSNATDNLNQSDQNNINQTYNMTDNNMTNNLNQSDQNIANQTSNTTDNLNNTTDNLNQSNQDNVRSNVIETTDQTSNSPRDQNIDQTNNETLRPQDQHETTNQQIVIEESSISKETSQQEHQQETEKIESEKDKTTSTPSSPIFDTVRNVLLLSTNNLITILPPLLFLIVLFRVIRISTTRVGNNTIITINNLLSRPVKGVKVMVLDQEYISDEQGKVITNLPVESDKIKIKGLWIKL